MKKKLWVIVAGGLTVLLLMGAVGAVAVYAQSRTPPTPSGTLTVPGGVNPGQLTSPNGTDPRGHGSHELDQAALNAAARVLGISADELSAQLQSGKTLVQIATAQGADIKAVMDAIRATRPLRLGTPELDAAAKALGMTSADLSTALQNGQTLAGIATEKGVSLQTVQDAITAAHRAEMTTQISQAVADGKITQDKANWLLEGLNKGYLDEPGGFGFGFGPGGPHGPRGQQAAPPAAPPTP